MHVQIDTYEDPRDAPGQGPAYHRGYCQIKVSAKKRSINCEAIIIVGIIFLQIFCDKGAERKARDEERRAQKRRATNSGKRRLDELYHTALERSEFYSMADIHKPPILFTPTQDPDKAAIDFGTELPRCVKCC